MKKLFKVFGNIIFVVFKPFIFLLINKSKRNRVAIIYKDEVLMVRSLISDNKWGFPGGGTKKHEDYRDAAIREVYEETGIKLRNTNIVKENEVVYKYLIFKLFLIFYKTKLDHKPTTNIIKKIEIVDVRWFKINDLIKNPNLIEDQSVCFIQNLKS